jgi:hypothetical protein
VGETTIVDMTATNTVDTADNFLEYCEACNGVDFIDYSAGSTSKCLSYLLLKYHFGDLTDFYDVDVTASSPVATCCNNLCNQDTGSLNRGTLSDAGVNMCKMTDQDCKSKVKRYIEKNASPIGIVVFVEVIFMYVVVYLTQKAITIFKDGDDDEDDDDDDDEE